MDNVEGQWPVSMAAESLECREATIPHFHRQQDCEGKFSKTKAGKRTGMR